MTSIVLSHSAVSPRSHLYVPADQPAKLAQAYSRGADALIVDLEDSVPPGSKDLARRSLADWLDRPPDSANGSACEVWVRVNAAEEYGLPPGADLSVAVHPAVRGIVVAKCESPHGLELLDQSLTEWEKARGMAPGTTEVAALIETARGLLAVTDMAASPRVARLQIGEADMAAALGMAPGPDRAEMLPLRLSLVVASAAAGIRGPVAPVHTALDDVAELRRSTESLRRLGFSGRAAVHPSQISVINEVFTPSESQSSSALDVLARFDAARRSGRGVTTAADGSVIDEAVARSARAVLEARADRPESRPESER